MKYLVSYGIMFISICISKNIGIVDSNMIRSNQGSEDDIHSDYLEIIKDNQKIESKNNDLDSKNPITNDCDPKIIVPSPTNYQENKEISHESSMYNEKIEPREMNVNSNNEDLNNNNLVKDQSLNNDIEDKSNGKDDLSIGSDLNDKAIIIEIDNDKESKSIVKDQLYNNKRSSNDSLDYKWTNNNEDLQFKNLKDENINNENLRTNSYKSWDNVKQDDPLKSNLPIVSDNNNTNRDFINKNDNIKLSNDYINKKLSNDNINDEAYNYTNDEALNDNTNKKSLNDYSDFNYKPINNTKSEKKNKNSANQISNNKLFNEYKKEKCHIIWTNSINLIDLSKIINEFSKKLPFAKFTYKKNILGFTFCSKNKSILEMIKGKYVLVNIEEDKMYKIGSYENDLKELTNGKLDYNLKLKDFQNDIISPLPYNKNVRNYYTSGSQDYWKPIQYSVPLHFYRISNLGNLFFNNYLLDNIIFRISGINRLIKYFYKYKYYYSGKNVKISIIDTPKCNPHKIVNSALISGFENSLGKNVNLQVIEALKCNGTILLSNLLNVLEDLNQTDILVLPISGPHSEALDQALKKISQKTIIIAAAGNDSDNACNYSPNGHQIIKIGSVDKHGYISDFSNRGSCVNLYSLGEDVLNSNGTSYSASFVSGAVAMYLEKEPHASHADVLKFLHANSMKNNYEFSIFKIPDLKPGKEIQPPQHYYGFKELIIYNIISILIIMLIALVLIRVRRRYRARQLDNTYIETTSLRGSR